MTLLVCGGREWVDRDLIRSVLTAAVRGWGVVRVVHGDCRGADRIAGEVAGELGLPVRRIPADWKRYGKRAGPIRNQLMLDECSPDAVIGFHADLANSSGTKDMVRRAENKGLPTFIIANATDAANFIAATREEDD